MINEDSGVIGEVEKPSVFGMIMNPKEQLEKIRNNPKSLMPVLIVTAVTFIGILLLYYSFTVPPELFEELSEQELQLALNVGKITLIVAGLIGPIFGITLASLIYFLVAKMIRSEVSFKQMFSMFAHLNIIGAIGSIIHGLAVLLIPGINQEISITSLESIVNAGGILGAVLNSVEIFGIWQIIITAIGLQIVAKFSKQAAWTTVIVIVLIGLSFTMISAGINSVTGF